MFKNIYTISDPTYGKVGTIIGIDEGDVKIVQFDDEQMAFSFDESLKLANSEIIKERLGIK